MHEFSVCRQIISEAKKHGSPVAVTIEVGELANMTPLHLKAHMKEYVDWKVAVKNKKGTVTCKCGYKGKPIIRERGHDFLLLQCKKCRGSDFSKISGDKIVLKSVKVK